jgi:hypothetical protein
MNSNYLDSIETDLEKYTQDIKKYKLYVDYLIQRKCNIFEKSSPTNIWSAESLLIDNFKPYCCCGNNCKIFCTKYICDTVKCKNKKCKYCNVLNNAKNDLEKLVSKKQSLEEEKYSSLKYLQSAEETDYIKENFYIKRGKKNKNIRNLRKKNTPSILRFIKIFF